MSLKIVAMVLYQKVSTTIKHSDFIKEKTTTKPLTKGHVTEIIEVRNN
jgi:hypothetical protein